MPGGNSADFLHRYQEYNEFNLRTQLMRKTYIGCKKEIDAWLRLSQNSIVEENLMTEESKEVKMSVESEAELSAFTTDVNTF